MVLVGPISPAGVAAAKAGEIPVLSRNCDAPLGASQVAWVMPNEHSPRRKGGSGGMVSPGHLPPLTRRFFYG